MKLVGDVFALTMAIIIAKPRLLVGVGVMAVGGLLLLGAGTYVALDLYGQSQFDEMTVSPADTGVTIEDLLLVSDADTSETETTELVPTNDEVLATAGEEPSTTVVENDPQTLEGALARERPGEGWDLAQLDANASSATTGSALGALFDPVDWDALAYTNGELPEPSRIIIPAIGLDSSVIDLAVKWDGDQLAWETADNAVGYHLGSPVPGERGNTVFSGHINSPWRGEGSIFARLPEVAPLLRDGRTVDIIVEAGNTRYLYRAFASDVMLPEEVDVFRTTEFPSLSLVTCTPATSYNYRFIVNAVLVGQAPVV